jgi:predicted deacetylase
MKFAIRDDDLNYFYTKPFILKQAECIWDICPLSMSVIPYVKGNWLENVKKLESIGSSNLTKEVITEIRNDSHIYNISDNAELVEFIKEKILEKKVHITMHAIHHRNEDIKLPNVHNNFSIGAEFLTDRDLTDKVRSAKQYIESTFCQKINVFTPPQNLLSLKGFNAINKNNMGICGYLPSPKNPLKLIKMIGLSNSVLYILHRLKFKGVYIPYPKALKFKGQSFVEHYSLQPGTNIEKLKKGFDIVYGLGGDFVLSTHSYAFNHTMTDSTLKMGAVLNEFLQYVKSKKNIQFVGLDELFE